MALEPGALEGIEVARGRDRWELETAAIFADVLGRGEVGIEDEFFAMGGDSMHALQLVDRLERHFGVHLEVATLYADGRPSAIAERIRTRRRKAPTPLVTFRATGERPALFAIHHVGGDVLPYVTLMRMLSADQPAYGLETPALERNLKPAVSIEAMAAEYINASEGIANQGPYLLMGWSLGGLVAFEMARQLRAMARTVGLVALLDVSAPPEPRPNIGSDESEFLAWRFAWCLDGMAAAKLRRMTASKRLRTVCEATRRETHLSHLAWLRPDRARARLRVERANYEAGWQYQGGSYDGDVVVFRATGNPDAGSEPTDLGWSRLVRGRIRVREVPGMHRTMVNPPHVHALASAVSEEIERFLPATSRARGAA